MYKKAFRINIDLPKYPKGTVVYHEYDILPSKFNANESYSTDGIWYSGETQGVKVQVWPWVVGLIESCIAMKDWEPTAKKLVTEIKK